MIGFQCRALVILTGLFLVLVIGIAIITPDDNQVEDFMTAMENCDGICLLGIQPGKTTVEDSIVHLQNHPWVFDVRQRIPGNGYAQIDWAWSGQQPNSIDTRRRGYITFYWVADDPVPTLNDSLIETVTIYTQLRIHTLHEWFGETDVGTVNNRPDGLLGYAIYYNQSGGIININAEMKCPISMMSYWNARARITVSIGSSKNPYIRPSDMIQMC